jgi:hypothetical protein
MLGHVGRFFDRVEFEPHELNVCRMDAHVKAPDGFHQWHWQAQGNGLCGKFRLLIDTRRSIHLRHLHRPLHKAMACIAKRLHRPLSLATRKTSYPKKSTSDGVLHAR